MELDLAAPTTFNHQLFKDVVTVRPLTANCQTPYSRGEHVCIGISPFNSLFSEVYIGDLIKWARENFQTFHLFLPDEPTFYTLEALGYEPSECRKKMKKQLNWLRNKINKALAANGLDSSKDIYLLDWNFLSANKAFNDELDKVYQLFDACPEFRNLCLEASRWVLQSRGDEAIINEHSLLIAVKYFLSEIPLFSSTNKIVGKETSLFCYHQSINFHKKLYEQALSYKPQPGQGYGVINAGAST
jgi:cyclo(L-tyrosyl-L-tyrosyl) synthase